MRLRQSQHGRGAVNADRGRQWRGVSLKLRGAIWLVVAIRRAGATMIKQVSFFKRKSGLTVDAFQQHWRTRHAELVCRLPGLRRYVQNHVSESAYRRSEPIFDGVAEAWFDTLDDMRANVDSAALAAIRADEPDFIARATMGSLLTEEHVVIDGVPPEGAVKLIPFINKRADISAEQFQAHWRGQHAALVREVREQIRYVQCHVRLGVYRTARVPRFDGVPMSWFASMDTLRASGQSPQFAAVKRDEAHFLATSDIPFVICRETAIKR